MTTGNLMKRVIERTGVHIRFAQCKLCKRSITVVLSIGS